MRKKTDRWKIFHSRSLRIQGPCARRNFSSHHTSGPERPRPQRSALWSMSQGPDSKFLARLDVRRGQRSRLLGLFGDAVGLDEPECGAAAAAAGNPKVCIWQGDSGSGNQGRTEPRLLTVCDLLCFWDSTGPPLPSDFMPGRPLR